MAAPPLVAADGASALTGIRLSQPASYILGAPLFGVLDALSVLTPRQHVAVILTLLALIVGRAVVARCRLTRGWRRSLWAIPRALLAGVCGVLVLYSVGILVWRPMVAVAVADTDVVVVDFHSHTSASHDGRAGFGAEQNREWHRAAGFHVAYVTDHRTLAGGRDATLGNPRLSGQGTVLLPGLEIVSDGHHVNVIGVDAADTPLSGDQENAAAVDDRSAAADIRLTLLAIPDDLTRLSDIHLDAVEISDAAPRGIAFAQRWRGTLLRMADSLRLAVAAGSDNHGWGRTAAAWSIMRIRGWRQLQPQALDSAIRRVIRERRRQSVRVVERGTIAELRAGSVPTALTAGQILWALALSMTPAERASWLAWLWGLHLALRVRRRRGRPPAPRGSARASRRQRSEICQPSLAPVVLGVTTLGSNKRSKRLLPCACL